jgi:hypothetical protein
MIDSNAMGGNLGGTEKIPMEVAVTVMRQGDLLLAGYNSKWEAYTLPMTKRRYWAMSDDLDSFESEPWEDAATRNLMEWWGPPVVQRPAHLLEVKAFRQSDRDLLIKNYHFQIYGAIIEEGQSLRPDLKAEWLSLEDFQDIHRRPISPTTRHLIDMLKDAGKLG